MSTTPVKYGDYVTLTNVLGSIPYPIYLCEEDQDKDYKIVRRRWQNFEESPANIDNILVMRIHSGSGKPEGWEIKPADKVYFEVFRRIRQGAPKLIGTLQNAMVTVPEIDDEDAHNYVFVQNVGMETIFDIHFDSSRGYLYPNEMFSLHHEGEPAMIPNIDASCGAPMIINEKTPSSQVNFKVFRYQGMIENPPGNTVRVSITYRDADKGSKGKKKNRSKEEYKVTKESSEGTALSKCFDTCEGKTAFWIVFIIVVLLVLYYVYKKKNPEKKDKLTI